MNVESNKESDRKIDASLSLLSRCCILPYVFRNAYPPYCTGRISMISEGGRERFLPRFEKRRGIVSTQFANVGNKGSISENIRWNKTFRKNTREVFVIISK